MPKPKVEADDLYAIINDIMWKSNLIIVIFYSFLKTTELSMQKLENTIRTRDLETRQTLNSTWYMKYPLQILGYHFNFTRYCALTECSRPSRYFIVSLANMYDNPSYLLTCIQFGILKTVQCLLSRQVADKSYPYTIGLKLIIIAWGDASVLNCKYLLEMLGYYPSIPNIPSYARVSKSVRMSEMSLDLKYAR